MKIGALGFSFQKKIGIDGRKPQTGKPYINCLWIFLKKRQVSFIEWSEKKIKFM